MTQPIVKTAATRMIVGLSCVLAMGACKKKDAGGAATGSGSAAVADSSASPTDKPAAAPAAPAACPANAWKEQSGLFCIDPQGYTPDPEKKNDFMGSEPNDLQMEVWFKKKGADGNDSMFHISWFPNRGNTGAIATAGMLDASYKQNIGQDKGTFAGTKGKYWLRSSKDDAKSHNLQGVLEGNQHMYSFEANGYDAPIDPAIVAAVKSFTPTD